MLAVLCLRKGLWRLAEWCARRARFAVSGRGRVLRLRWLSVRQAQWQFGRLRASPNPSLERTAPAVHAASLCQAQCRRVCRSTQTLSAAQYSRGYLSGEYECSLFSVFEKGFGNSRSGVLGWLGSPSLRVVGFFALGGSRLAKLRGRSIVVAPAQPVVGADSPGGACCLALPSAVPPGLPLNSNVERCAIPAGPRLRRI